ncbi:MAG: cytochrome c biogenesis protein [Armatimonadota bacterium]|nr:MAG: cytochrome c biogenesis protein [Armatimonadota bacterium]
MLADLSGLIASGSIFAYALVVAAGVVTSIGPCNMAMVPVIVAFVGGSSDISRGRAVALSAAFALGAAVTFTLLGVAAAVVGGLFGPHKSLLYYIVSAVCILLGLSMLGAIRLQLPGFSAQGAAARVGRGIPGAFLLGMVVGLAGSQCGTPALAAILSVAMAQGKIAYGAALLFAYGLGRGVPIIVAGASAGAVVASPRLASASAALERVAGVVLIGVGLFFWWRA